MDELYWLLLPELTAAARIGGSAAALELAKRGVPALAFDWNQVNEAAANWAEGYTLDLARGLSDTTRQQVIGSIAAFQRSPGMSRGSLERLILEGPDGITDLETAKGIIPAARRAEMIAVTETTRAYSAGEVEAMRATGLPMVDPRQQPPAHVNCRCNISPFPRDSGVMSWEWQTLNDAGVCPICGPLNSQDVGGVSPSIPSVPAEPALRFKTTEDAEKWVVSNGYAKTASFEGFDIRVANEAAQSLEDNVTTFPQLKGKIDHYGGVAQYNATEQAKAIARLPETKAELRTQLTQRGWPADTLEAEVERRAGVSVAAAGSYEVPQGAFAVALDRRSIFISDKYYKSHSLFTEAMEDGVAKGFHPQGAGTVKACMDHEIMHVVEGIGRFDNDMDLMKTYSAIIRSGNAPSEYARKNFSEFIAEAWSEYRNSKAPRDAAVQIGKQIEDLMNTTKVAQKAAERAAAEAVRKAAAETAAKLAAEKAAAKAAKKAAKEAAKKAAAEATANTIQHAKYTNPQDMPTWKHMLEHHGEVAEQFQESADDVMASIVHDQGFDGLPTVVDAADLDARISKNGIEIWRGVLRGPEGPFQYADQFREGDFYIGTGVFGNGTYTAAGEGGFEIASGYARGGTMMRMTLKEGARIARYEDLNELYSKIDDGLLERVDKMKDKAFEMHAAGDKLGAKALMAEADQLAERSSLLTRFTEDDGRFAASYGYDAIFLPGAQGKTDFYVILNRTAMVVERNNYDRRR